jgi:hypothetical protein
MVMNPFGVVYVRAETRESSLGGNTVSPHTCFRCTLVAAGAPVGLLRRT